MKSDITIEHNGKTLIIDTKFYNRIIHSGNLYQIFTYVKNKDVSRSGNVSGVLLYAKTDEAIDAGYMIGGNKISVKTLDLNKKFSDIKARLNNIVEEWR